MFGSESGWGLTYAGLAALRRSWGGARHWLFRVDGSVVEFD